MSPRVVVIDAGSGNILSVVRALEVCGAAPEVSGDPAVVRVADRVLLPGVGAFGDGIATLNALGLADAVREVAGRGRPLLGICLGMQLLFDQSEEFGLHDGLGLLPGRVVPLPTTATDGARLRIPHMGWAGLLVTEAGRRQAEGGILHDVLDGHSAYFVHSFHAVPTDTDLVIAQALYGGHAITAAVQRDLVLGTQFHPEKSGAVGLGMMRAFLTL